jgi:hypothetical protein
VENRVEFLVPLLELLENKVEEVQKNRVSIFIVIFSIVVHGKKVMLTSITL